MFRSILALTVLGTVLFAIGLPATAEDIVVSDDEVWDGSEMHGITPAREDEFSPFIYNIPAGLTIKKGGSIRFDKEAEDKPGSPAVDGNLEEVGTTSPSVSLVFTNGGLNIEEGGSIDIGEGLRNSTDPALFEIQLGKNSITGKGRIYNSQVDQRAGPMSISITGGAGANISLAEIDQSRKDAESESVLEIEVGGEVTIDKIFTAETDPGGASAGPVSIKAAKITVGDITTYSARANVTDPSDQAGSVILDAAGTPGPDDKITSTLDNSVTVTGTIDTAGPTGLLPGGDVEIHAVVVNLASGCKVKLNTDAMISIETGAPQGDKKVEDLFKNEAGIEFGAEDVKHTIEWTAK